MPKIDEVRLDCSP